MKPGLLVTFNFISSLLGILCHLIMNFYNHIYIARGGHPKERLKSVFTVGPTAALAHRQINFLSLASPGLRGIQKLRGQNFELF